MKCTLMLRLLPSVSRRFLLFSTAKPSQVFISTTCSTQCPAQVKDAAKSTTDQSTDAVQVFREWGCNDDDVAKILGRNPHLSNSDAALLQSKLALLSRCGLNAPDLVRIINCRPRFLSSRVNRYFNERLAYLNSLFESKALLKRALVTNPSLLIYDFDKTIKPVLAQYEELGVSKEDFLFMTCSRPTLISRTSFDEEKLEYIRKTGLSKDSKRYKYVVSIIGISRLETIREKIANFAKFGFSDEEIFELIGRSPFVLTLSIEKVQRNMTFVLGTINLEAKIVLRNPHLLFCNLDTRMKPRALLMRKIEDMDSKSKCPQTSMATVLRMREKRFIRAFIECHSKEVADELLEFYMKAKEVKRLADSSRKCVRVGFPF
ncbi:uncharacterized protein LOC114725198 [Neltuma alba]|uniref:uncharacterized protein LOC114725198 n=1 Tax=Neltuma alba TaxID=207710 RepID=UPI0010A322C0|nr:uncharacterized protein LOC114725198 [Prosopis alba]